MAGGGIFLTHNKVLPGAYINFVSKSRALGGISERGVAALSLKINWGKEGEIVTISSEDFQKNAISIFGYSYDSLELRPIREVFKCAKELKFFRLGKGEKAKAILGNLTVNAKYGGTRGNSIKIKISQNVDNNDFTIFTYLDGILVDEIIANNISDLTSNSFVEFSGTGDLAQNAGTNLLGGTDEVINKEEYSKFLSAIETEIFNVLIFDGEDDVIKGLFDNFTKRLRNEEGVKIITVLHNYSKADFEGVISLKNKKDFVYWVGGALAGAEVNESLTNKKYDGEYIFDEKFSNSQLKDFIKQGEFVLYSDSGEIKVLKDINTFTDFSVEKNSDFSNNQIIRVLDSTANDIARIFNDYYLGKMQNDELGRDIFKAEVISYFRQLQAIRAVDNFNDSDIFVLKGTEKGDVIIEVLIEPIAGMDKIYMKCIVE